ncbi:MAG: hypothetical protein ABI895_33945 [Deltaproteobacteria bacterium]
MQRLRLPFALAVAALLLSSGYWLLRTAPLLLGAGGPRAAEPHWVTFEGACDASGAVPIDERHFAVADDEDNVIRAGSIWRGSPPRPREHC